VKALEMLAKDPKAVPSGPNLEASDYRSCSISTRLCGNALSSKNRTHDARFVLATAG